MIYRKSISILGCGWIGFPLAQALHQEGYTVNGSTSSSEKIPALKKAGINPFLLHCTPNITGNKMDDFFSTCTLVMTLPFKRDLVDPRFYFTQIKSIASAVEHSSIEFVIFTSSTSVYPNLNKETDESEPINTDTDRAQVLLDAEQLLLDHPGFEATILRLGGLYGYDRQLGRYLSGKQDIPNGDAPVNLIHRDDVIGLLCGIIQHDCRGEIFNGVADEHPTRKELYVQKAQVQGISTPQFLEDESSAYKIVRNNKVKEVLGYSFLYPSPLKEAP